MKLLKIACLLLLLSGIVCSCGTAAEEAEPEEMQPVSEEAEPGEEPSRLPLSEVKSVTLYSRGLREQELSEAESAEVLDALAEVEWYGTGSQSYLDYDGCGGRMFRLELEDGGTVKFGASSPFYIIDESGYKSEYRVCQAISKVYWKLNDKYFGDMSWRPLPHDR